MSSNGAKVAKNSPRLACWVLLVASVVALIPVQQRIEGARGLYGPIEGVLYLPSGKLVGELSLGNKGLLADIYWTRVDQYFGRKRLEKDVRLDLLGSLLSITTELDPHLLIAYRFGAIFLAAKAPEGAGQPEKAIELLRHGIVANPDYWRFWQDMGFIYYWDLKDYPRAVRAFTIGSKQPGAELWMKAVAAMVAAKGGDPKTSEILWTQIYKTAENDQMRQNALDHLAALRAHEEITALNRLLLRYRDIKAGQAHSLEDLIASGLLSRIPIDPSGVPYIVGPDGKAALGPGSKVKLYLIF